MSETPGLFSSSLSWLKQANLVSFDLRVDGLSAWHPEPSLGLGRSGTWCVSAALRAARGVKLLWKPGQKPHYKNVKREWKPLPTYVKQHQVNLTLLKSDPASVLASLAKNKKADILPGTVDFERTLLVTRLGISSSLEQRNSVQMSTSNPRSGIPRTKILPAASNEGPRVNNHVEANASNMKEGGCAQTIKIYEFGHRPVPKKQPRQLKRKGGVPLCKLY
jgi:hypothetical protein